ncbi:Hypothetical predicted protein, partial [Olea europaea subsp. europaea]
MDASLLTEWTQKKPTGVERADEAKNYHEVEKIVSHRTDSNGKRHFTVKWTGYDEEDELEEEALDGCLNLLQDYLRNKNMPLSKIEGELGASGSSGANYK